MNLEQDVLQKIKPSEKEAIKAKEIVKSVIDRINKEGYEAILVGSFARNTAISPIKDLDIFVYFPQNMGKDKLESGIKALGKKLFKKIETHYAEHPYVRGYSKKIRVELVPCYRIKEGEKIISAVDRTPLHNEYLLKELKKKQIDEVLLFKQFLKSIECYGADQKVKGFSGYLCELLILHYGSFDKLIKAATKWEKKTIIDIKGHGSNFNRYIEPLIVIDPVDENRNVASAVDRTTLTKFIWECRSYLENPNLDFFFRKERKTDIKKKIKGRKIISITTGYPDVIEEIAWSQLERLTNNIKERLHDNDFTVYRTFYWSDEKKECDIIIELLNDGASEIVKHKGPEIWDIDNTKAFIKKNKDFWFYRSRVFAWKERKHKRAEDLVRELLKEEEIAPSYFKGILKKAKIRSGKEVYKNREAIKRYFREG